MTSFLDHIGLSHFDDGLTFDASDHTYQYDGLLLTSVTTLIKSYSPEFDSKAKSKTVARRDRRTSESVLKEWEDKASRARDLGTEVHEFIQELFSDWGTGFRPEVDSAGYKFAALNFFLDNPKIQNGFSFSEVAIAHPDLGIAGTIDTISIFEDSVTIIDWKTNARLSITGYDRMFPPISSVRNADIPRYRLQLSMYGKILRDRYGVTTRTLSLVHLKPSGHYQNYVLRESRHLETLISHWQDTR